MRATTHQRPLAERAREAVALLLAGLERAAARDVNRGRADWLSAAYEAGDGQLYAGLVTVILRVVFVRCAEERALLPTGLLALRSELTASHRSRRDRHDAYPRLLALFRALHRERGGALFDPAPYPFLEGRAPGEDVQQPARPPELEDEVVLSLLRLLITPPRAEELEVELLGSIYESLIDDRVVRDGAGYRIIQTGDARRRAGSHYTPQSLSRRIVTRALAPLLACLGETPTAAQLLELKICDPAMGSGAFLLEACRQLAARVVTAWRGAGDETRDAIASRRGDPDVYARQLVARRCLYGVDKDARAVELAKLSLWLETRARALPFRFVDHALRCGDSLVGLELDSLARFSWREGAEELPGLRRAIQATLARATELRDALRRPEGHASDQARALLDRTERVTARLRLIADLCVGAFFHGRTTSERERERTRRRRMVITWLAGDDTPAPELRRLAAECRARRAPFHWWLELPELAGAGPLAPRQQLRAMIGNPPFMGQSRLSGELGDGYRDWLFQLHPGSLGKSDLSPHFLRRAARLLGDSGALGFVTTNTIGEGDTRRSGLKALLERGWGIYAATRALRWPGDAVVVVSVVHLAKGTPLTKITTKLPPTLDGRPVPAINSRLRPRPERAEAVTLAANARLAFLGCWIGGQGFTLRPDEARALPSPLVKPYIGGAEINKSPTQAHKRYVIDFAQRDLEDAARHPALLERVRARVKPERDNQRRKAVRERWWQFGDVRPGLRDALAELGVCLVNSQVTKHLVFARQPTDRVFAHTLYVYPLPSYTAFAVLQSRAHEPWARLHASTMKTDLRYTATNCFDTFAFPRPDPRAVIPTVEAAGERFYGARARFMAARARGLTKTYNALKDPTCRAPAILELRRLSEAMDRAVLDAYGWRELEVPPLCPSTAAERAAVRAFEDEIIDRLYLLNEARTRSSELPPRADSVSR